MKFATRVAALISLFMVSTAVLAVAPANTGTLADAQHADALRPHYRIATVDGHKIFYREAGDASNPTIILLHGFPGSSFAYRDLIPLLADRYHVIAPDLPGFGYSDSPPRSKYRYTFDNLTTAMDHLTEALGLKHYVLYVCDYGATVGYRLALAHPERVSAIISQNGNAYDEGITGKDWAPIKDAWEHPSKTHREAVRYMASPEMTKYQWIAGVPDASFISPDTYILADYAQAQGENREIQADLLTNFATEQEMYPKYQAYFRKYQPPLLAVWGKDDPFFLAKSATAFKRDLPKAEVHLYDTSHFALETHVNEIAWQIREFLGRTLADKKGTE
ncbi:Pimeloyl-ACP methyl ester carboxylesterase [Burkholderia sp. OK233]|nr:Pimeloyl-ACP methyl ester carboxylesterase [Burkholderia sp. OK233]